MARRDDSVKELQDFIKKAQEQLQSIEDKGRNALDYAHEHKESVEDFVRDNPLIALGGAFALGYLVGKIFVRRKR